MTETPKPAAGPFSVYGGAAVLMVGSPPWWSQDRQQSGRPVYRLMGKKARLLYYVRGRRMDYASSSSGKHAPPYARHASGLAGNLRGPQPPAVVKERSQSMGVDPTAAPRIFPSPPPLHLHITAPNPLLPEPPQTSTLRPLTLCSLSPQTSTLRPLTLWPLSPADLHIMSPNPLLPEPTDLHITAPNPLLPEPPQTSTLRPLTLCSLSPQTSTLRPLTLCSLSPHRPPHYGP
ncbi:unnamed protein product [Boreogadus saida]